MTAQRSCRIVNKASSSSSTAVSNRKSSEPRLDDSLPHSTTVSSQRVQQGRVDLDPAIMGPKKTKQVMSLGTFLGDQSLGSWADEMEDQPMPSSESRTGYGGERRGFGSNFGGGGGGGAERSEYTDRGFSVREQLPLPSKPPYTAHLGNLSFDVTEGDINEFFANCEVATVRIVEDKIDHKPKGFGYVEFRTLDGLKQALSQSGSSFQGRNIRVSVADPPKDRPDQRELTDWTRKGPLPDLPQNNRRISSGPPRSFDAASDAGSDRGGSRRGPPPFEGDGKTRDFGNWERRGPLSPSATGPPPSRERPARGAERSFERRPSPAWGEGRSQDGSRPPRPVPERQPTAAEMDNQWRARMKPDAPAVSPSPTPDVSTPSSPAAAPAAAAAPASRPRLNLQKRTVSEAPADVPSPGLGASESKASPFGAARPIDTAARDAEIADKRTAARKQKEEEEKALAEKKQAEKAAAAAAAKAERGSVPPTPTTENGNTSNKKRTTAGAKEPNGNDNGPTSPTGAGRQYEILRRVTDQDDGAADEDVGEDAVDAPANGNIVDDKSVKPKELVRDLKKPAAAQTESTAEELEGAGWSTVEKPTKHRKQKSQSGSRALAS